MYFIFPLLIVVGLLVLLIGVILAVRQFFFLRTALAAQGVVTHVEVSSTTRTSEYGPSAKTLFRPTVRFQTRSGQVVENATKMATSQQWEIGQSVIVNYEEGNPSRFVLGDRSGIGVWVPFIIVAVVGVFMSLIGTVMSAVMR